MRAIRTSSVPDPITSFTGPYGFLSNFAATPFAFAQFGECLTAEHAFQASKAATFEDARQVLTAYTPREAKRLGRQVPLRLDWERAKLAVMRELLSAKFTPGTSQAIRLVETGDRLLVEGNSWGDTYWGAVRVDNRWSGENWLGWLLMAQRAYLIGSGK